MKKFCLLIALLSLFMPVGFAQNSSDYPLLSQGKIEPPPPPSDFGIPLLPNPSNASQQAIPMLPPVNLERNNIQPSQQPVAQPPVKVVQAIKRELYEKLKQIMRSIFTFRTIVEKPESDQHLRRIQNLVCICAELLGLQTYPVPSRFVSSYSDRVLRDRSYEAVEYRHFGDFDQRLNGWIKPISNTVYIDLIFDGRDKSRTHVRAQISRSGTLDGHFYAYGWDKYGRNWKLQGTMSNLLTFDNGLPFNGELKIYGVDPTGKSMALALQFPVKILGIAEPIKKEIRHHQGQSVSIGNR